MTEPLHAVLDRVLATGPVIGAPEQLLGELRAELDDAALTATDGVDDGELPLLAPKGVISKVLACEQHLLETAATDELSEPVVRGRIVDRLLQHHVHGGGGAHLPDALAVAEDSFGAERDDTVLAWLGEHGAARQRLADDAVVVTEHLATLGAVDARWWPRCETRLRVDLAGGRVRCSAQLDLVLGGHPTELPLVVLEAKSGRFVQEHRHGLFWYAVLAGLRFGRPPAAVIGWSGSDGATWCQPVTEAVLVAATERAAEAIVRLGELARGRPPRRTASSVCAWCPAQSSCDVADQTFGDEDV
jgi:hypothetical protein